MQRRVLSGKGSSLIVGADLEISKCFKKKSLAVFGKGFYRNLKI
jgi:hypothetical protein